MTTTLTDIHELMIDKLLEDAEKFEESYAVWNHSMTDEIKSYFETKGCELSRILGVYYPADTKYCWLVKLPEE